MFSKVRKKLLNVKYAMDSMLLEHNILTVKGWIFSPNSKVENVHLIFLDGERRFTVSVITGSERMDVYEAYRHENAKKSGFWGQIVVENFEKFEIRICCKINGKYQEYCAGSLESTEKADEKLPPRARDAEWLIPDIELSDLFLEQGHFAFQFPAEYYKEYIDVIIPVYNGYTYLKKLLQTVVLTKMKYRLILINDKSTDERVNKLLLEFAGKKDNVILIENERNLGFVKTVNKGLEISKYHVALVNTDVELPEFWLERLMLPILKDEEVASSTPYTNSGTICSFPERGRDNRPFLGLDVQEIDSEFQKIRPRYGKIPTGVGFCMGMNKKAISQAGYLDEENFGKGYGEENDWCQRVIPLGYKNVQVENLFVYHKHGGSFLTEDKKRYMEKHRKILREKHPYYDVDVARFFAGDTHKSLRGFLSMNLLKVKETEGVIFAFDHGLGGGATKYLEEKRKELTEDNYIFGIVRYDLEKKAYQILFKKEKEYELDYWAKDLTLLQQIMECFKVDELWVNELVSYPDIYAVLDYIRKYSEINDIKIKMLMHDFFSICPTVNLVNHQGIYCNLPEAGVCDGCIGKTKLLFDTNYDSIAKWRSEWGELLRMCQEVVTFSESSKKIVEKAYGQLHNIVVRPHRIKYLPKVNKKYKMTDTLNIGLLGMLTEHKGLRVVQQMIAKIEQENLDIRIILMGRASEGIFSPVFQTTGEYTRGSIPRLVLQNDIDVFLVSSVWPETFSYTTGEIMEMDMPVMCFDLGAPSERVKKYKKGIVIPEISADAVLSAALREPMIQEYKRRERRSLRVLFVVEDVTFSSRYRVDHLREQLLYQGIASDCISIYESEECELVQYASIVVYRSSEADLVTRLVNRAHDLKKNVHYDIDDYIFDYSAIKNLKFLDGEDYTEFETYSEKIRQSMEVCDGYIVSTNNLKYMAEQYFEGKPVVVNRNVSSMEMIILSKEARENRKQSRSKAVKLGYFSGSKTHDEDFNLIKDEILYIMESRENVHLVMAGAIELPDEFQVFHKRIHKYDFVPWRNLPELIAKTDINLMPLENTTFHACKSENKWMEAALAGVPTVASKNSELLQAIENGVTGYLCSDGESWRNALLNLIDGEEHRKEMAEKACNKVMDRYTPLTIEPEVLETLIG